MAAAPAPATEPVTGRESRFRDLTRGQLAYAIRRAYNEFFVDQCMDLAATLTYYGVLAIFPGMLAVVSLLGVFGEADSLTTTLVDLLSGVVPGSTIQMLRDLLVQLVQSSGSGWALVVGLVGAAWSTSAYIGAMGRALNRVYDIAEGRRWWILRPQQVLMAATVIVLVALALLGLIAGGPLARSLAYYLGFGSQFATVLQVIRWPLMVVVAILLVAALYYGTPNVRQPRFRWISPGAVLALAAWAVMSLGFMVYVGNWGHYNQTYGALGGVIVFLVWLWLVNVALLGGAELDAQLERVRELAGGIRAERSLQLPPRDTRASVEADRTERALIEEGRDLRERAEVAAQEIPEAGSES